MPRRNGAALPDIPWFEGADLYVHLDREGVSEADRAFAHTLARDGLATFDLGPEGRVLCDHVVAETEDYFDGGVTRVQDAWLRSPAVRRLAVHPGIGRRLRLAYGREPYAFQTLNFRTGSQQEVHSDAIHFHTEPERFMCGVWIALEDIRPEAGPLLYHPGSHRMPVMTMRAAGVDHDRPTAKDYNQTYAPALQARLREAAAPVAALPRKGEVVVWAANLAHGGAPVTNPASTRRSLVVHHFFKGCLPFTPMTSDIEGRRLSVRLPMNVATGLVEWPRRGRSFLRPGEGQVRTALGKLLLRRIVTA